MVSSVRGEVRDYAARIRAALVGFGRKAQSRNVFAPFKKANRMAAVLDEARATGRLWRDVMGSVPLNGSQEALFRVRFRRLSVEEALLHRRLHLVDNAFDLTRFFVVLAILAVVVKKNLDHPSVTVFTMAVGFYVPQIVEWAIIGGISRFSAAIPLLAVQLFMPLGVLYAGTQFAALVTDRSITSLLWETDQTRVEAFASGVLLSALTLLPLTLFVLVGVILVEGERRWSIRRYPDVITFRALLIVLRRLNVSEKSLADTSRRKEVVNKLEGAVRVVEQNLTRSLHLPHPSSAQAAEDKIAKIANWMRSYEMTVAFPETNSWAELKKMLAAVMSALCTGNWGALPLRHVNATVPRRRWLRLVATGVRSLVVALMPLAVVLALNEANLMVQGAAGRAITTAAAVWTVLGVLLVIDPMLANRIQATKDLTLAFKADEKK